MPGKTKILLRKMVSVMRRAVLVSLSIIVLLPAAESYAINQNDYDNINTPFYDECTIDGVANSLSNMPAGDLAKGPFLPDNQIPGKNTEEKIWNYLIGLGFEPEIAAGILGNINHEGSFPTNIEDPAGETKDWNVLLGLTGQTQGYGLIGFTPGRSLAKSGTAGADWSGTAKVDVNKDNFYFISTQLAVVYGYMKNYNGIYDKIVKAKDEKDAAFIFLDEVENPADPSGETPERQAEATVLLNRYRNNKVVFGQPNNIYVLGDSISARARTTMKAEFQKRGAKNVTINASVSRSITANGVNPKTSGLEAAASDKNKISKADKIVIELGTNQRDADFQKSVGDLYKKIHGYNKTADIYWAGVFSKGGSNGYAPIDRAGINTLIKSQAGNFGFNYIDTEKANIPLDDSVHQTHPAGSRKLVETIAGSVFDKTDITSGGATASKASGNCVCPVDGGDAEGGPAAAGLHGGTNAEKIFNYLIDNAGLSAKQSAGAVGSLMLESGGNTEDIDPTAENPSSHAYGIAQWLDSRKTGLDSYAAEKGGDISDLAIQAGYLVKEMKANINGYDNAAFKKIKTVEKASVYWTNYFEGLVVDASQQLHSDRIDNSKEILRKYGDYGGGGGSSSATAPGNCACAGGTVANDLSAKLKELSKENGGQTQIAVSSLNGGAKGDAGGEVQMPTRSSYKIYTAYATLKAIEDGRISWDTRTSWGQSVEATMEEMIIKSNNDAAEALRTNSRIGTYTQVTNLLQNQVGLSDKTVMGSGSWTDAAGSNSKSTANDFNKFLIALEKHKLAGVTKESNYNKLLGFMKKASTDDGGSGREGIVAGVGAGVEVADKPGWASGSVDPASNDVGIVYLKENTYVLSILTDKPYQWDGVAKIAKEVHAMMGGSPGGGAAGCAGLNPGDLTAAVKAYAWPDHHDAPYTKMMPDYKTAVKKAQSGGRYVGGEALPGIDCGGFITTAMVDSGFETRYNSNGKGGFTGSPDDPATQWGWLQDNWQKINPTTTKDLEPGDVAINGGHTYMYVGKIPGFNSVIASASLDSRAPMAGEEAPADPDFTWYRKK